MMVPTLCSGATMKPPPPTTTNQYVFFLISFLKTEYTTSDKMKIVEPPRKLSHF